MPTLAEGLSVEEGICRRGRWVRAQGQQCSPGAEPAVCLTPIIPHPDQGKQSLELGSKTTMSQGQNYLQQYHITHPPPVPSPHGCN